jgi:hypothetical protein
MSNAWLNALMGCYIEREIFKGIDPEKIKKAFQKRKIDKCSYLDLLDLNTIKVSLSPGDSCVS